MSLCWTHVYDLSPNGICILICFFFSSHSFDILPCIQLYIVDRLLYCWRSIFIFKSLYVEYTYDLSGTCLQMAFGEFKKITFLTSVSHRVIILTSAIFCIVSHLHLIFFLLFPETFGSSVSCIESYTVIYSWTWRSIFKNREKKKKRNSR